MTTNTGGPAFPFNAGEYGIEPSSGMSLRDWFAGQALAGMFRHDGWLNTVDGDENEASYRAYRIADAMLKEREK